MKGMGPTPTSGCALLRRAPKRARARLRAPPHLNLHGGLLLDEALFALQHADALLVAGHDALVALRERGPLPLICHLRAWYCGAARCPGCVHDACAAARKRTHGPPCRTFLRAHQPRAWRWMVAVPSCSLRKCFRACQPLKWACRQRAGRRSTRAPFARCSSWLQLLHHTTSQHLYHRRGPRLPLGIGRGRHGGGGPRGGRPVSAHGQSWATWLSAAAGHANGDCCQAKWQCCQRTSVRAHACKCACSVSSPPHRARQVVAAPCSACTQALPATEMGLDAQVRRVHLRRPQPRAPSRAGLSCAHRACAPNAACVTTATGNGNGSLHMLALRVRAQPRLACAAAAQLTAS